MRLPLLKKLLYLTAPGGYSMYWAIVIGVIVLSGYLVGGVIPQRFPNLSKQPIVQIMNKKFLFGLPVLQLGSLSGSPVGGGGSVVTTTNATITPRPCTTKTAFIFLIDTSASMRETFPGDTISKINATKQALQILGYIIPDESPLGIVTFNDTARVLVPVALMQSIRPTYPQTVSNLTARGTTHTQDAMQLVQSIITTEQPKYPDRKFSLIFMSDGQPNPPTQDPIPAATQIKANLGVTIYSVAASDNDPQFIDIMKNIASTPTDRYYVNAQSSDDLNDKFADIVETACTMDEGI